MVAISEKKDQPRVINTIRLLFELLRFEIENIVDKELLPDFDDQKETT
jgi:hypothetical protein